MVKKRENGKEVCQRSVVIFTCLSLFDLKILEPVCKQQKSKLVCKALYFVSSRTSWFYYKY